MSIDLLFILPIRSLSLKWNWCWCWYWPISSLCLPFKRLQLWNSHQRVISIDSLVENLCMLKNYRIQWKWITIHVNNSVRLKEQQPLTKTSKNKIASKSGKNIEIWIQTKGCAWITCYILIHWNIAMKLYLKSVCSAVLHVSSSFARCFITERKFSGKMWHCRLITNQ